MKNSSEYPCDPIIGYANSLLLWAKKEGRRLRSEVCAKNAKVQKEKKVHDARKRMLETFEFDDVMHSKVSKQNRIRSLETRERDSGRRPRK